jgi:hypothetical protein
VKTGTRYKIHLIYNAKANVSSIKYEQNQPSPFSFDFSTKPMLVPYSRPSAHLIIDADMAWPEALSEFESALYGDVNLDARLPTPSEVYDIFNTNALFKVIDNNDGTFTLDGPDELFTWVSSTEFSVDWPKIIYISDVSYKISSW